MTTAELKKYIYDNNKIEYILQQIGCGHIVFHLNKNYYSASNYNGDNPSAVNVKNNEFLNVINWTRTKEFNNNSDIISLVEYNKQLSFLSAIKYLHKILGLSFSRNYLKNKNDNKVNLSSVFQKVQTSSFYSAQTNINNLHFLNEQSLDNYYPLLHIKWFKEGIMPWTREKFGLLYSYRRQRVIIPIRYWATGELLGFNSRTTIDNYEEFGIRKYLISPDNLPKNVNLFGLWENRQDIEKAGYVVVYESEKSVLKRDSINDHTGVALSGHTISDEQVRILIKLNVDIIISLDKDIDREEIRYVCEKFYGFRNVYYTFDTDNIMSDKNSIADEKKEVFDKMIKNKIKYDYKEHELYLKANR